MAMPSAASIWSGTQERIVYTDKFDDPNLPGEMKVTVTLRKSHLRTELNVVQETSLP